MLVPAYLSLHFALNLFLIYFLKRSFVIENRDFFTAGKLMLDWFGFFSATWLQQSYVGVNESDAYGFMFVSIFVLKNNKTIFFITRFDPPLVMAELLNLKVCLDGQKRYNLDF